MACCQPWFCQPKQSLPVIVSLNAPVVRFSVPLSVTWPPTPRSKWVPAMLVDIAVKVPAVEVPALISNMPSTCAVSVPTFDENTIGPVNDSDRGNDLKPSA